MLKTLLPTLLLFAANQAPVDTSKLTPLTDLGIGKYRGFEGGLYPGGKNTRPAKHEAAGLALAKTVQPLDAEGKPSKDGKIVLLAIGFSNTVQAFAGFRQVAKNDKNINPRIVLVNGAMGGMSANMVQNPDDQGRGAKYWASVDDKLKDAGVTRAQVQVLWIKETNTELFPKRCDDAGVVCAVRSAPGEPSRVSGRLSRLPSSSTGG